MQRCSNRGELLVAEISVSDRFIHRQAKQQASRSQDLFFSDVVPVASTEPHVAAAAFLHLLALTSRDQLRVGQDEPYGEVSSSIARSAAPHAEANMSLMLIFT